MKAENVIGPASIVSKPERPALGIRLETPFDGMFARVTQELKHLRKWVKDNGLAEEGPYFLRVLPLRHGAHDGRGGRADDPRLPRR